MASELEEAYVSLRWKILYGELPPGHAITVKCTAENHDLGERKSRLLLNALAADGYLYKTRFSFSVAMFSHDQIEEWRQLLCAFTEIGAGRLVLEPAERLEEFRRHVEETLGQWDIKEERFYLAALTLCALLLGGQKSALSRLAGQLLPQVFFRLLWLADSQSPDGGFLLEASRRLIEVAPKRSVKEAKAACGIYFDGIADSLHAQLDLRNQSPDAGEFSKKANQLIEPRLTGHANVIGTPMQAVRRLLIPELRDAPPASLNFAVD
jgi:DNA-binding GntR family transcriptional regulator